MQLLHGLDESYWCPGFTRGENEKNESKQAARTKDLPGPQKLLTFAQASTVPILHTPTSLPLNVTQTITLVLFQCSQEARRVCWGSSAEWDAAQADLMVLVNSVLSSFLDNSVLRSSQYSWGGITGNSSAGSASSDSSTSVSAELPHSAFCSARLQLPK